jgi:hypothetical protein
MEAVNEFSFCMGREHVDQLVAIHLNAISGVTHRQTDRQRQTDIYTDRQADRQTDRQADRQTDRQTDRQNEENFVYCVIRATHLDAICGMTDGHKDRQIGKQNDRQTEKIWSMGIT